MTYKQNLSLNQQRPFGIKKHIQIDINEGKVQVKQHSSFQSEEVDIDLDRLNPNTQRIKQWPWTWFLAALTLTLYMGISLSAWLFNHSWIENYKEIYWIIQPLLGAATCIAWWRFFVNMLSLTIFFDKYTHAPLFSLFTNNPEEKSYQDFLDSLKKIIVAHEQTRNLRTLLNEMPTYILIEEFSSSYLDELSRRGIDIIALLSFLQKRATNMNDINHRPSLQ